MSYRTLDCEQGDEAWHGERIKRRTASEAPAMMGASKFMSRTDLLDLKHTGLTGDVSRFKQSIFDEGHEVEAKARAILEQRLGELYPVTAVHETDDRLLASVDGITIDDETLFEHKQFNEELAAQVRAGQLDPHYYWQLEQELLVTGAKRVIFVCSDGTPERWAEMEYVPVAGRAQQLIAGWDQFDVDLATHVPVVHKEQAKGEKVTTQLPALSILCEGKVVTSNLAVWREQAKAMVKAINTDLQSDEQFGQAGEDAKWCRDIAKQVEQRRKDVLAGIVDVNEVVTTLETIADYFDGKGLELEKLIEARKLEIRTEVRLKYEAQLTEHMATLQKRLGDRIVMPPVGHESIAADFVKVMKGLKTVKSLHDRCGAELSRAKIAASAIADRLEENSKHLHGDTCKDWQHLFQDVGRELLLKQPEDFRNLCASRIQAAQQAEAERKAREEARLRQEAEAAERRRQEEAARTATPAPTTAPVIAATTAPAAAPPAPEFVATGNVTPLRAAGGGHTPFRDMPVAAPAGRAKATPSVSITALNEALGINVTSGLLEQVGYPAATLPGRTGKFYSPDDMGPICRALARYLDGRAEFYEQQAAA